MFKLPNGEPELRTYSDVARTRTSLKESIFYEVGTNGAFRPCVHKKLSVSRMGDLHRPFSFMRSGDAFQYAEYGALHRALADQESSLIDASYNQTPVLVDFDWQGLTSSAVSSMRPSLNTGNSLINFLVELRDFKRLGKRLMLLRTRWYTWYSNFKEFIRLGGAVFWAAFGSEPWNSKKKWKNKRILNAFLAWKLAWQPFISDIKSFIKDLTDFRRKIVLFERRSHWRQQRYWGRDVPLAYSGQSWITLSPSNWLNVSPDCSTNYSRQMGQRDGRIGRFTAVMRYHYSLDRKAIDAVGTVLGTLDILGVSANPAIIWDSIPFSFIIDWFFGIGDSLESLKIDNLGTITHITDLCVSLKYKKEYETITRVDLNSDPGDYNPDSVQTGRLIGMLSYYERRVIDPSTVISSSATSGLNVSRGAVAASLLLNGGSGVNRRRRNVNHSYYSEFLSFAQFKGRDT